MDLSNKDTALVITDPQNDFLNENGVAWGLVKDSLKENNTIDHIEQLLKTAKEQDFKVFVSPHYFYPTDHDWQFGGTIEKIMFETSMFDRTGSLDMENFRNSGADFLERLKPYLEDGKTVIASPHKVYGPENNDLILQLRKFRINKIILAGMSANLCVEAHMREFLEQGFEVIVVKDATAAARHPDLGDGYKAALVNFAFMANEVVTTKEAVKAMSKQTAKV